MPLSMPSAVAIFTEICVVWRRPYTDSNVVIGISANPSNDWPSTRPLAAMTPTTVNCWPRMRTCCPTGDTPANKLVATSAPTATTYRCSRTSISEIGWPAVKR